MAQQQPARHKTQSSKTPVSIPDKLYFRIGDVSRLCSLPAYVLRFWETEFPQLKPNKGGTGQRLYRKRDVEMVLQIKHLLYDEGFTIAGARRLLAEKRRLSSDSLVASREPSDASDAKGNSILDTKESESTDRSSSGISKATSSKTPSNRPKVPGQPSIKALREEMRALLTLLGSSPQETKPLSTPARRDTKKTRHADEPTLF